MSRRVIEQPTSTVYLENLIGSYTKDKKEADRWKKIVDDQNKQIKEEFKKRNLTEFIVGDIKATVTETPNEDFNELQAMEILRANLTPDQLSKCIKTREYLDDAALSDLIFNGEFDAALLASCKTPKAPTFTLRIGKAKSEDK